MKRYTLSAIALLVSANVFADPQRGQKLHDEHCQKCHDTSVYTRKDRFITDRAALTKQVNRCKLNVGAQWFDEDVADVVDYLNSNYYKFK
jgi:hypothetical protein